MYFFFKHFLHPLVEVRCLCIPTVFAAITKPYIKEYKWYAAYILMQFCFPLNVIFVALRNKGQIMTAIAISRGSSFVLPPLAPSAMGGSRWMPAYGMGCIIGEGP